MQETKAVNINILQLSVLISGVFNLVNWHVCHEEQTIGGEA